MGAQSINICQPQIRWREKMSGNNFSHCTGLAVLLSLANLANTRTAAAHGTVTSPPSRVYNCYLEGPESPQSAACQAARATASGPEQFYNWNGVRQGNANDNHQAVVPNGQLCSGGDPGFFGGLDLARNDWVATRVSPGTFTFQWTNTAPHDTAYYHYYITRNGHNHNQPLQWSDLEFFCRIGPSGPQSRATHPCSLPARTGKHIVYSIWQRTLSQSPEAFYACVDVDFGGSGGGGGGGGGGPCANLQAWNPSQAYVGGDQVQHNGIRYQANWWNQNRQPDLYSGAWQEWTSLGRCQ